MVKSSPVTVKLNLEPRPPTPPRESENTEPSGTPATGGFFSRFFYSKDNSPRQPTAVTPKSSADLPNPPSRKKVGWSELYEYKDPPSIQSNNKQLTGEILQPLPPSAERRATKSILKAYHGPDSTRSTTQAFGSEDKISVSEPLILEPKMLEATVKQLAGQDRNSRLDAYIILSGALKASDNVPNKNALAEKMGLLLQFIQRDLTAKNDSGSSDIQLIREALVLFASFLERKAVADMLTTDFNNFILDYALKTFGNPDMSKEIAKLLMFILARQKFPSKVMTADRVTKLLSSLHNIEDYVRGKSIIEQRINVYRTFLRQAKSQMISNTEWLGDLFSDMLSTYTNVRSAAIAFGQEAGLTLGSDSKVSSKFVELFKTTDDANQKYGMYYADRLKNIAHKKPPGPVPQIWTVAILFLRARPLQLQQWALAQPWLEVIQVCFNSSEQSMRLAANIAWNRMVFVIHPDEKTSDTMVGTLSQPLIGQLRRKDVRKVVTTGNLYRRSILSTVCNLLYYSLRPDATYVQIERYWDQYMIQIIRHRLIPADLVENAESAQQDLSDACSILHSLFDSTTQRGWNETRAIDEHPVAPTELPALDSRWVRKNALRVFQLLDPLIEMLYWDLPLPKSKIRLLWVTYISSIASATSKEVKTSNDTMSCLASLFNTLYKIWQKGADGLQCLKPNKKTGPDFFGSFGFLVSSVISGLGVISFTERLLCMGQQDEFLVVATPSHRPGRIKGEIRTPLQHLFLLFATPPPGVKYDSRFTDMVRTIITPFFDARKLSKPKMDLAKDLLECVISTNVEVCSPIWSLLATFATEAINLQDESIARNNIHNERPLGGEYRNVVRIIEVGIDLSPHKPLGGWIPLFEALVMSASIDAGDGGRAIAVIEPIAKALVSKWSVDDNLSSRGHELYCQLLLSQVTYPKDRQALDASRRCLWGTSIAGPRISAFDPYSDLYDYTCRSLQNSYMALPTNINSEVCNLLSSVEGILGRCPKELGISILARLQDGLVVWTRDDDAKINSGTELSNTVSSLWAKICSFIPQTIEASHGILNKVEHTIISGILHDLDSLISSGLESKHSSVANITIEMLKIIFGNFDGHFEYPQRMKEALHRLRPMTDIPLPSLSENEQSISNHQRQPPVFFDTQSEAGHIPNTRSVGKTKKVSTAYTKPSKIQKQKSGHSSPRVVIPVPSVAAGKRSREITPETGKRKSRKKSSIVKLRHEDSQIQFEAITGSSPISDTTYDSQLLTERQKEVRQRQQEEAATMFPDLRSSPRPKPRSSSNRSDKELDLHSSSASRLQASANVDIDRQTTPDTPALGDQDNFLVSSPTPVRSASKALSGPPSSPPGANEPGHNALRPLNTDDMTEIPSSPPQFNRVKKDSRKSAQSNTPSIESSLSPSKSPILGNSFIPRTPSNEYGVTSLPNNASSGLVEDMAFDEPFGHSAHIDTNVLGFGQTFSTYKSTPREPEDMDTTVELTSTEEQLREAYLRDHVNEDQVGNNSDLKNSNLPSTPRRSQRINPPQQAPNTPTDVFLDARSSPLSSDKILGEDETFEDAVSSPRLLSERLQQQAGMEVLANKASSPLSDLDESSLMRLVEKFDSAGQQLASTDQNSFANRGQVAQFSDGVTRASPNQDPGTLTRPKIIALNTPNTRTRSRLRSIINAEEESSANRSLVPETPAHAMGNNSRLGQAAKDFDPETTIVVQIPDTSQPPGPSKSPRRTRQRSKTPIKIENEEFNWAGKRKIDEITQTGSEVPDSQGALVIAQSVAKQTQARPSKKRRGRSSNRDSQVSTESIIEAGDSPSIEPDLSMQISSNAGTNSGRSFTSNAQATPEPTIAQVISTPQSARSTRASRRNARASQEHSLVDSMYGRNGIAESSFTPIVVQTSSAAISNEPSGIEASPIQTMVETAVDEGKLDIRSSPMLDKSELEIVEETLLQSQLAEEMSGSKLDEIEEIEDENSHVPTYETLKDKLTSLVNDLGNATLSRKEVSDMEDLFMEAKIKLFGTIRRE